MPRAKGVRDSASCTRDSSRISTPVRDSDLPAPLRVSAKTASNAGWPALPARTTPCEAGLQPACLTWCAVEAGGGGGSFWPPRRPSRAARPRGPGNKGRQLAAQQPRPWIPFLHHPHLCLGCRAASWLPLVFKGGRAGEPRQRARRVHRRGPGEDLGDGVSAAQAAVVLGRLLRDPIDWGEVWCGPAYDAVRLRLR